MPALKLYMTPGSCSTAINIILEELEEVFEAHIVNIPAGDHLKPEYVAINPKGTIPALVRNDGSVLTEITAIAVWLGKNRGRAALWPRTAQAEARALEIMSHVTAKVHGEGFTRIFTTGRFATNPAEHADVQALGRRIVEQGFQSIESSLPAEGFIAGEFSVADAMLFYVEFWADKTAIALPPKLAAHYALMLTRPAVRRVLREEGYDPAKLGKPALA